MHAHKYVCTAVIYLYTVISAHIWVVTSKTHWWCLLSHMAPFRRWGANVQQPQNALETQQKHVRFYCILAMEQCESSHKVASMDNFSYCGSSLFIGMHDFKSWHFWYLVDANLLYFTRNWWLFCLCALKFILACFPLLFFFLKNFIW